MKEAEMLRLEIEKVNSKRAAKINMLRKRLNVLKNESEELTRLMKEEVYEEQKHRRDEFIRLEAKKTLSKLPMESKSTILQHIAQLGHLIDTEEEWSSEEEEKETKQDSTAKEEIEEEAAVERQEPMPEKKEVYKEEEEGSSEESDSKAAGQRKKTKQAAKKAKTVISHQSRQRYLKAGKKLKALSKLTKKKTRLEPDYHYSISPTSTSTTTASSSSTSSEMTLKSDLSDAEPLEVSTRKKRRSLYRSSTTSEKQRGPSPRKQKIPLPKRRSLRLAKSPGRRKDSVSTPMAKEVPGVPSDAFKEDSAPEVETVEKKQSGQYVLDFEVEEEEEGEEEESEDYTDSSSSTSESQSSSLETDGKKARRKRKLKRQQQRQERRKQSEQQAKRLTSGAHPSAAPHKEHRKSKRRDTTSSPPRAGTFSKRRGSVAHSGHSSKDGSKRGSKRSSQEEGRKLGRKKRSKDGQVHGVAAASSQSVGAGTPQSVHQDRHSTWSARSVSDRLEKALSEAPVEDILMATWRSAWQHNLICEHPYLGDLVARPPIMCRETPDWWEQQNFIPQTLYDHEVFSRENDDTVEGYDPDAPTLSLRQFVIPGPFIDAKSSLVPQVAKDQYTLNPEKFQLVKINEGLNCAMFTTQEIRSTASSRQSTETRFSEKLRPSGSLSLKNFISRRSGSAAATSGEFSKLSLSGVGRPEPLLDACAQDTEPFPDACAQDTLPSPDAGAQDTDHFDWTFRSGSKTQDGLSGAPEQDHFVRSQMSSELVEEPSLIASPAKISADAERSSSLSREPSATDVERPITSITKKHSSSREDENIRASKTKRSKSAPSRTSNTSLPRKPSPSLSREDIKEVTSHIRVSSKQSLPKNVVTRSSEDRSSREKSSQISLAKKASLESGKQRWSQYLVTKSSEDLLSIDRSNRNLHLSDSFDDQSTVESEVNSTTGKKEKSRRKKTSKKPSMMDSYIDYRRSVLGVNSDSSSITSLSSENLIRIRAKTSEVFAHWRKAINSINLKLFSPDVWWSGKVYTPTSLEDGAPKPTAHFSKVSSDRDFDLAGGSEKDHPEDDNENFWLAHTESNQADENNAHWASRSGSTKVQRVPEDVSRGASVTLHQGISSKVLSDSEATCTLRGHTQTRPQRRISSSTYSDSGDTQPYSSRVVRDLHPGGTRECHRKEQTLHSRSLETLPERNRTEKSVSRVSDLNTSSWHTLDSSEQLGVSREYPGLGYSRLRGDKPSYFSVLAAHTRTTTSDSTLSSDVRRDELNEKAARDCGDDGNFPCDSRSDTSCTLRGIVSLDDSQRTLEYEASDEEVAEAWEDDEEAEM